MCILNVCVYVSILVTCEYACMCVHMHVSVWVGMSACVVCACVWTYIDIKLYGKCVCVCQRACLCKRACVLVSVRECVPYSSGLHSSQQVITEL